MQPTCTHEPSLCERRYVLWLISINMCVRCSKHTANAVDCDTNTLHLKRRCAVIYHKPSPGKEAVVISFFYPTPALRTHVCLHF